MAFTSSVILIASGLVPAWGEAIKELSLEHISATMGTRVRSRANPKLNCSLSLTILRERAFNMHFQTKGLRIGCQKVVASVIRQLGKFCIASTLMSMDV